MSRFRDHRDMTADDLLACSIEIGAILDLVETASYSVHEGNWSETCGSITTIMTLAKELQAVVHDALELHEGGRDKVRQVGEANAADRFTADTAVKTGQSLAAE